MGFSKLWSKPVHAFFKCVGIVVVCIVLFAILYTLRAAEIVSYAAFIWGLLGVLAIGFCGLFIGICDFSWALFTRRSDRS